MCLCYFTGRVVFVYVIVTLLFVYFINYLTEWLSLVFIISNCFYYECVTVVMYGYYGYEWLSTNINSSADMYGCWLLPSNQSFYKQIAG